MGERPTTAMVLLRESCSSIQCIAQSACGNSQFSGGILGFKSSSKAVPSPNPSLDRNCTGKRTSSLFLDSGHTPGLAARPVPFLHRHRRYTCWSPGCPCPRSNYTSLPRIPYLPGSLTPPLGHEYNHGVGADAYDYFRVIAQVYFGLTERGLGSWADLLALPFPLHHSPVHLLQEPLHLRR